MSFGNVTLSFEKESMQSFIILFIILSSFGEAFDLHVVGIANWRKFESLALHWPPTGNVETVHSVDSTGEHT